ncbi:hypothetical protein HPB49_009449 [Dermacentor silvarum]|uniref:Uncharacterized protein n=1 Tax=Dermacentor silvarum TaxID=543639 RepID=A0ACB8C2V1_DERSI|nr:hypothetical protein HPB49_009449 [Dermacentor silvarum]
METDEEGTRETPDNGPDGAKRVSTGEDAEGVADGWIEVTHRRRHRTNANEMAGKDDNRSRSPMCRGGRSIVNKVLRASRMPRLPRDDIKIIVRPKDGLNIRNTCGMSLDEAIRKEAVVGDDEEITICPNPTQNILVISTPDETTATKIAMIKVLTINGKRHETNAYVSAPEQMVKGIIRNIPLKYTQDQLTHALVNSRNPSLAYAKRLGSTTTVILLYEGNRGETQTGPRKVTWSDIVAGRNGYCVESTPATGSTRGAPDRLLAARMEKMERENKELRKELGRARKQNEQSARKIDELQQTLDEILKNMKGSSHERISSSTSREAAERGDVTAIEREVGEMDTCCGEEAPATAGSKRKGTSDAPPTEDAVVHAQAPKRPRSGARKIDAIEEMVNKLTDKTERMFDMLLTRLNESDAGRNAQYAAVNTQLAAMNKRIEDLERGTMQLQHQQHHHHLPGRAGVPSPQAINVPAIVTSGNNANTTRTGEGGMHGQLCPPNTSA